MSYIDSFDIEKTTAAETYNKFPGKMIELSAGSKKNRLKFELPSNDTSIQTAANVYVEVIGDGLFERSKSFILSIMSIMHLKFLKTTYKGKTIYINMNSLSNRLGVKVDKTCSDKIFHSEIEKQFETVCKTEKKIDAFFKEVIKKKYTEDGDKLKTANGESSISKTHFRKLLGITAFSKFPSKKEQEAYYSLKDGNILLLKKEEGKEWPLLTLFTKNFLGSGCFGTVSTVQELSIGRLSVAKITHNFDDKSIKNEDRILSTIFHNSNPVGIQQKPYSLFNFRLKGTDYHGYIAPKYDSSLTRIMQRLKPDEKIESARQLLNGLKALEDQQISHRDIKEDNCLFRKKNDGSIECVIADFGSAIDLSLDRQVRHSKKTDSENNKLHTDRKNFLLRSDVYCMGFVLDSLLGSYIKKENFKELHSLISQMLEKSWEKRISASEALAEFERIISLLPNKTI